MRGIRRFLAKLGDFVFRGRAEREMAREIDAHLALLQDDFERRGMTADAARLAARRAYGGVEYGKELHRDERSFVWLEQALQDLRHACRGLARSLGFTTTAVITLALGVGVNTTLFTFYDAVALKPLPVADPDHVVRFQRWVKGHRQGASQSEFSYPEYAYCRDHGNQFSSLIATSSLLSALGSVPGSPATEKLSGQLVSDNYFSGFGIHPVMGRTFLTEEDGIPSPNRVVVISYPFWKRAFHEEPQVLGRAIALNGVTFTVIGIAPKGFTGTSAVIPDFWASLSMQPQLVPGQDWLNRQDQQQFQILGRLKPSTDLKAAQAQADLLVRQFGGSHAETDATSAVTLAHATLLPDAGNLQFHVLVAALMLIPGLVLFVACANVGNMLLARGAARRREITTRMALGADRSRIVRQLLAESVLLSCFGGCAGLLISIWSTRLLAGYLQNIAMQIGGPVNTALNLTPDARVIVYVLVVSLGTGVLFGLSPALHCTSPDLTRALKDEGVSLGNLRGSRLRSRLVAAQVAVSMFLLASAGLLTRGLLRSQSADLGLETRNVFVVTGDFTPDRADPAMAIDREQVLAQRLLRLPEFTSVALGGHPFNGGVWYPPIIVGQSRGRTLAGFASDTYLSTLGIPLLRGRNFTAREATKGGSVAVISESTARHFWPNVDAVGKHFELDMDPAFRHQMADFEVIGIAKDVRFDNPTRIDPSHVYLPTGVPGGGRVAGAHGPGLLEVLVRIQGPYLRALATVETTVGALDRDMLPSLRLINLEDGEIRPQRTMSELLAMVAAILAALAITLAGIGIYGVVAYLVYQRTREIGIRMALGANSRAVLNSVVLQSLRPVFAGTILGLAVSGGLSSVLHLTLLFPGSMDLLYGVPFYDPVTFGGLFCFVLGVAALASAVPAQHALGVDPMTALRYE